MASAGNNMPIEDATGAVGNMNVNVAGNALPDENERVASTGNASSGKLPQLLTPAQALAVMMDGMRALQDRMLSIAGALGNAADVSGARGFLQDFAQDASRMHARLAGIQVLDAVVAPVA